MRYSLSYIATPFLALTLLASGCHSSLHREATPVGDTELTLSVSLLRNETPRALLPDDQTLVPGAEGTGEDKVAQMQLWLEDEGPLFDYNPVSLGTGSRKYQGTFRLTSVESESTRRLSVMLNGDGIVPTADFLSPDHKCELNELDRLIKPSGFTMTAEAGLSASLKPGVKAPSPANGNYIPQSESEALPVERVVSKAQLYQSGFKADVPGAVSNLRWAVAGSGKQVYLFRNHAGDLQMTAEANGRYKDLTTASDKNNLMKLSEEIEDVNDEGNFAWKKLSETPSGKKSVKDGIYFYEHALTETKGKDTPYPRAIGYDKVTYAKVYADLGKISKGKKGLYSAAAYENFAPMSRVVDTREEAMKLLTSEIRGSQPDLVKTMLELQSTMQIYLRSAKEEDFTGHRWYWVCVTDIPRWNDRLDEIKKQFDKSRFSDRANLTDSHQGHTFFLMHDTPGTFYVGANGTIYNTLLAAMADGNKSARKYTGGRMVYMTPLNAQGEPDKIYNCDTRRNNIYDLEIQGVNGLGYNYDPVDPDDPYIPKPNDNPLEPDPEIPPINNPLVAIRVKARILKWNYIHQSYDLLGETK